MARRGKEMNKEEDEEGTEHHHHHQSSWSTLEELLLACAVNRHGAKSWDSIAMELQKRASSRAAAVYSPPNCKQRYHDLRRRFSSGEGDGADGDGMDKSLVDELKKLRVAELRREVERSDVSIELLELKVKRLEEEREQGGREGKTEEEEGGGTDLPDELDNREPEGNSRRERSGSGSGNDNQSFNESNSTSNQNGENRVQNGDEPEIKSESDEPVPVRGEVKPVEKCSLSFKEEWAKENNTIVEVESPRKKKRRRCGEDETEGGKLVHAKEIAVKSQPLIKILVMLRSHKNGSLFERRLRSQETEKYKKMIRQHMDLQTVQSRLDRGFYLDDKNNKKNSHLKFFRDLLLLYTNAIIFFPPSSPHHIVALELRQLLTNHMPTTTTPPPKPEPKQSDTFHSRPDNPVSKLKQTGNNPLPAQKSDPGKKQPGTNPVAQKSEPGKKEPVSLQPRANKVGGKLERVPEAKPHSNRVSTANNKALEDHKSSKNKQVVKERPDLSRRSGRVIGSGYSEKEREKKKKTPPKVVEEDSSDEDDGETEKEKKRRGERGRNSGRGKGGRPPSKSPVGRDGGGGKRGRREGGEPPPVVDSGRPRKRSKK